MIISLIWTSLVLKHNFDSTVVHATGPQNRDEWDGILPEEICSNGEECWWSLWWWAYLFTQAHKTETLRFKWCIGAAQV